MAHSKNKGNRFELEIVHLLEALGYEAVSSRSESKRLDDAGVDIVTDAPYNIQCKHVERMSVSVHELLANMPADKLRVVMHKRNHKGTVVSLHLEDFRDLWIPAIRRYIVSNTI